MAIKKVATRKRVPVKRATRVVAKEEDHFEIPAPAAVPLLLYRRIALAFVVVVVAVLLVVMYLSTMQAVIHIKPVAKDFSSDLIVHTAVNPVDEYDIRGVVASGTMNKTKTFAPSGEGAKKVDANATGTVTLTNKTNAPQALVVNTRLLSDAGVLFRMNKGVSIPAGGTMDVEVHADKPGETGNIAPSHFTIPGLASAKQTVIFGDSKEEFKGGVQTIAVVSKEELQKSMDSLKEEMMNDAKDMLRTQAGQGYDGEVFTADVVSQKSSVEPDAESKDYDVSMSVTVVGVFYDKNALKQLFTQHLYEGLGQGQDFLGTNVENMQVSIDQFDIAQKVASLHAHLDGKLVITRTNKALDTGRFVGMSADEVTNTLTNEGLAESARVDFFPFWLNRIPRLKDHITIQFD